MHWAVIKICPSLVSLFVCNPASKFVWRLYRIIFIISQSTTRRSISMRCAVLMMIFAWHNCQNHKNKPNTFYPFFKIIYFLIFLIWWLFQCKCLLHVYHVKQKFKQSDKIFKILLSKVTSLKLIHICISLFASQVYEIILISLTTLNWFTISFLLNQKVLFNFKSITVTSNFHITTKWNI